MKISKEEVKHIAKLSRLSLSETEMETFGVQLNTIIEHMEHLNGIETSGIEPTSHVIPLRNVMRDDLPAASLSIKDALKNAPDSTEKFYRVPKIIE